MLDIAHAAVAAGQIRTDDPDSVACLLLGALAEAGTVIGRSGDPEATRARMTLSLDWLIDALCTRSR